MSTKSIKNKVCREKAIESFLIISTAIITTTILAIILGIILSIGTSLLFRVDLKNLFSRVKILKENVYASTLIIGTTIAGFGGILTGLFIGIVISIIKTLHDIKKVSETHKNTQYGKYCPL